MVRRCLTIAAAVAGLALCAPAGALAACPGSDLVPDASNLAAVGQVTLCLVNEQRAANGLGALSEEARLSQASTAYSRRMVAEQFFEHVAPDGSTLVQRLTGVGYLTDDHAWNAGENIAWGQGSLATPGSIVEAWMNSAGHRANILSSDYDQIGLGLALGSPTDAGWGATYTTDFGRIEGGSGVVDRTRTSTAPRAKTAAKHATKKSRCYRTRAAARRAAKRDRHARARVCKARARSTHQR